MGVELVEGRDLVVDDGTVYARTIEGLIAVDVIYRRIDDAFLDPVAFRPDSTLGVPGLLGALRAGTVTVCNAVGNGAADDKAVYPYVPEFIRYYLGEAPIIENVDTYIMWDPDQRAEALGRLDELVVKPVGESGGYGVLIGPQASDEELEAAGAAIEADPRNWIVQELVQTLEPAVVHPGAPRAPARGSAPIRSDRRADRGVPRRADPCGDAARVAHRELLPGRRLEGHLGADTGLHVVTGRRSHP